MFCAGSGFRRFAKQAAAVSSLAIKTTLALSFPLLLFVFKFYDPRELRRAGEVWQKVKSAREGRWRKPGRRPRLSSAKAISYSFRSFVMTKKVLFIGLDGATFDVLDPLMNQA